MFNAFVQPYLEHIVERKQNTHNAIYTEFNWLMFFNAYLKKCEKQLIRTNFKRIFIQKALQSNNKFSVTCSNEKRFKYTAKCEWARAMDST